MHRNEWFFKHSMESDYSDSESKRRNKKNDSDESKCRCTLIESGGKAKITLTDVPVNGLDITIVGGPCAGHWSIRRTKGKASMERKNWSRGTDGSP